MNHSQNIVDKILQATNNGLDIILEIFPQANTRHNFRIRDAQDDISVIPIVVISSRSTPADMAIARDAGASAYIVKPVTVEALDRAARELIPGFAPVVPIAV